MEAERLDNVFAKKLQQHWITNFEIVNIVESCNLGCKLNSDKLSLAFNAPFTPALFPGPRIRLPDCTAVVFHTGKCNFLGAKCKLDIQVAFIDSYLHID